MRAGHMCEAEARRYAVGPANLLEDLHAPPRTHDADPGDACELCPNRRFPGSGNGQDHVRVADTVRQGCAGDTLKPLQFTTISTMVPGFTGSIEVPLPVPFTYDLQIASTRYFSSLDDGEIPLLLLFSGTLFGTADGRMRVQQVPWSKETTFRLPVSQWREAVDTHFPDTTWITCVVNVSRR